MKFLLSFILLIGSLLLKAQSVNYNVSDSISYQYNNDTNCRNYWFDRHFNSSVLTLGRGFDDSIKITFGEVDTVGFFRTNKYSHAVRGIYLMSFQAKDLSVKLEFISSSLSPFYLIVDKEYSYIELSKKERYWIVNYSQCPLARY